MRFADARGGGERRWLSFSFRRVTGAEPADDCILAWSPMSPIGCCWRASWSRRKADGDSQAELLLQLVRADPLALVAFLDDADTAFRKSNAILTGTGIGQPHLQKKLIGGAAGTRCRHRARPRRCRLRVSPSACRASTTCWPGCAPRRSSPATISCRIVRLDELMSHAATMRVDLPAHRAAARGIGGAGGARPARFERTAAGALVLELS